MDLRSPMRKRDGQKKGERYAEAFLVATAPLARIWLRTAGNRVSRLHRVKRGHLHFRLRFAAGSRASQSQRTPADDGTDPRGKRASRGYLTSWQAERCPSNPALSLAFWLQGKMHSHDLVGYLASQLLGAVLGAGLVVLIWREWAASVHNGITAPGMGYPIWSVF